MGMNKHDVKVWLKEASRRPFKGRVLTLGRQDVFFSEESLRKMALEFGIKLSESSPVTFSRKPELAAKSYISDDYLFKSLGFSESKTMDFSTYESADYIFDLNEKEVPERLLGTFDVIFDGGTIEHIFHLPNVLNNLYKMLARNGRIIHISPSSNFIDHGFYMFSPTLFWDFYKANKFEINNFQVIRSTSQSLTDPWEVSNYEPGCLSGVSLGGLGEGMHAIVCVVTKTEHSTGDVIPQQGSFLHIYWKTKNKAKNYGKTLQPAAPRYSKFQAVKNTVKRFPLFYGALLPLAKFIRFFTRRRKAPPRKKGLGTEVIAYY